jgi:uncharacterized SAM-binding protein YcdF (DUF218 family)
MPAPAGWSRRRRAVVALAGVIGALWLGSAARVFWLASHDEAAPADAIVVLGAAQYRGRPSPVLRARLDHAVALFAQGYAPRLVLSGGTAEGDTQSEAAVARQYVMRAGVPDSSILLESDGRTTEQSLRAVAQLLRVRGLERVILVSDPFHLFRTTVVARRYGLAVRTSPTRADDAWDRLMRQPGYFLAESVKAPAAFVFAW